MKTNNKYIVAILSLFISMMTLLMVSGCSHTQMDTFRADKKSCIIDTKTDDNDRNEALISKNKEELNQEIDTWK